MRRCNGDRSPPTRRILWGVASSRIHRLASSSFIAFIHSIHTCAHSFHSPALHLSMSVIALHGVGPTRPVAVHHIMSSKPWAVSKMWKVLLVLRLHGAEQVCVPRRYVCTHASLRHPVHTAALLLLRCVQPHLYSCAAAASRLCHFVLAAASLLQHAALLPHSCAALCAAASPSHCPCSPCCQRC